MMWIRRSTCASSSATNIIRRVQKSSGTRRGFLWGAAPDTEKKAAEKRPSLINELRCSKELLDRGSSEELNARLAEDGYLLFSSLLPVDRVLDLRGRIITALDGLGWIDKEQQLRHPPFSATCSRPPRETELDSRGSAEVEAHDWPIFDQVQKTEAFHALPHSSALLDALALVFREEALMHPRHILRVHFPRQPHHRTLPHQDFPYVQGTQRTLTCWCPLGAVPLEHGPLAILVGSHLRGLSRLIRSEQGQDANMMVDMKPFQGLRWATRSFSAGDVLMMHSHTVHMGLNNDSDQVRLSLDCRAQPASLPVSERALQPNWNRHTWDEIYAAEEWADKSLQYYWKQKALNVVEEGKFEGMAFHTVFDPANY